MKALKFIAGIWFVGLALVATTTQTFAQIVLPEIIVRAANYKYLNAMNTDDVAQPVSMIEQYAAAYDIKGTTFYEDDHDNYFISFLIPEGKILAAYDKDGTLLRTVEKYKNVDVPRAVKQAVADKYPKWAITKDVYLVNYQAKDGGVFSKQYKLLLENGDKRLRVKITDTGEFL